MASRYRMTIRMDPELRDFLHELRNEAREEGKKPSLNDVVVGCVAFVQEHRRVNRSRLSGKLPLTVRNASKSFG